MGQWTGRDRTVRACARACVRECMRKEQPWEPWLCDRLALLPNARCMENHDALRSPKTNLHLKYGVCGRPGRAQWSCSYVFFLSSMVALVLAATVTLYLFGAECRCALRCAL